MRVEMTNAAFGYGSSGPVLSDLDLVIESGSVHAIVGASGCGKTTALRVIGGLETLSSGQLTITGERRHPNQSAFVFESPRLVPWWDVGRNIGIGVEFTRAPAATYERIKDFYTAHVGLGGMMGRLAETLSHGQQARVGLGRALARDADILLMDEPFTNLDALARQRLHRELEALWMASPRTMILVTHDIEEAVALADRVSVMRPGPGPLVETVTVDAPRPRTSLDDPSIRSASQQIWEALERGA